MYDRANLVRVMEPKIPESNVAHACTLSIHFQLKKKKVLQLPFQNGFFSTKLLCRMMKNKPGDKILGGPRTSTIKIYGTVNVCSIEYVRLYRL